MEFNNTLALNQMDTIEDLFREDFPRIDNTLRYLLTAEIAIGIKKVIVVGDGDSYHAAIASQGLYSDKTLVSYIPISAMKFLGYDAYYNKDYSPGQTIVIGVSASGGSTRVVQCLRKVKQEMPFAITMALTGNIDSPVAQNADIVFDCSIAAKGSAPGIRSYVASLFGLTAIALRLGELQGMYHMSEANKIREAIPLLGSFVTPIMKETYNLIPRLKAYTIDTPLMVIGTRHHRGTAMFFAAKFLEIAGVLMISDDIEEWGHVGRFSYPKEQTLFVVAPKGNSYEHGLKIIELAKSLGRSIVLITDDESVDTSIEKIVITTGGMGEYFYQFLSWIPSVIIASDIGNSLNRKMFHTDTQELRDKRRVINSNLKKEV